MKFKDLVATQTNEAYANELMDRLAIVIEVGRDEYNEELEKFKRMMDDANTDCNCDGGDDWDGDEGICRQGRNYIIALTRTAKRVLDGTRPTDDFYRRHKTNELLNWLMGLLKKLERERYAERGWEFVDDDDWER